MSVRSRRIRSLELCDANIFGQIVITKQTIPFKNPRVRSAVWTQLKPPPVLPDDDPKEYERRRASVLLDQLLLQIYSNLQSGCSDYNSATSTKSHKATHRDIAHLKKQGIEDLRLSISSLEDHVVRIGSILVRQLKRRDALRRQRDARCDVISYLLRKRVPEFSPEMRFSIEPLPGDSGFSQWQSAMKMVSQLPEGIPPEFRRRLWLSLADKHLTSEGIDWAAVERSCFSEWSHPSDAELGVQIVKDLHRTGCSLFCGKDGQENQALLKKVLLAYARWNKAVGYCQGFNMLAALILQVTEKCETDALKLMIYLIEGVLPDSYFADSLRGLSVDMAVFRELLRTKLPRLSKHLDTLQVASKEGTTSYEPPLTNVFTMQWFLTLFCNCLPQPTVLRVWDLIMLEGNEILLRTSLAIWKVLGDRIMTAKSADEFYCVMGTLMREILEYDLIDANTLIKGIVSIGPLTELNTLREHYLYNINPWGSSAPVEPDKRLKVYHKDRLILDIGVLKKQYTKLKQRQRQAHIIFNTAVARQTSRPAPVAMNHLLLGKSALVPAKRLGPPKGAVPPARVPPLKPQTTQPVKTLHWKDTSRRDSSSSSTSSSDTELCDEHDASSDEECQFPDDNLNPSDKKISTEDNTNNLKQNSASVVVSDLMEFETKDNQTETDEIKSDIFDNTDNSDLFELRELQRSDSTVSEDGFDFEKFLEERVKSFKEKTYSSEESIDDTSEQERLKYARRNSVRALEIIQENSLILHRILQCQSRMTPTPPPTEEEDIPLTNSEENSLNLNIPDLIPRDGQEEEEATPTNEFSSSEREQEVSRSESLEGLINKYSRISQDSAQESAVLLNKYSTASKQSDDITQDVEDIINKYSKDYATGNVQETADISKNVEILKPQVVDVETDKKGIASRSVDFSMQPEELTQIVEVKRQENVDCDTDIEEVDYNLEKYRQKLGSPITEEKHFLDEADKKKRCKLTPGEYSERSYVKAEESKGNPNALTEESSQVIKEIIEERKNTLKVNKRKENPAIIQFDVNRDRINETEIKRGENTNAAGKETIETKQESISAKSVITTEEYEKFKARILEESSQNIQKIIEDRKNKAAESRKPSEENKTIESKTDEQRSKTERKLSEGISGKGSSKSDSAQLAKDDKTNELDADSKLRHTHVGETKEEDNLAGESLKWLDISKAGKEELEQQEIERIKANLAKCSDEKEDVVIDEQLSHQRTIEGPLNKTRDTIDEDRINKKETYSFGDVADQRGLKEGMSGSSKTIEGPLNETRDPIDEDGINKMKTYSFEDIADQGNLKEGMRVSTRTIGEPLSKTRGTIDVERIDRKETYSFGGAADQRSPKEGISISSRTIEGPLSKTRETIDEDRIDKKETYPFGGTADQRSPKEGISISSIIIEGPLSKTGETIDEDRMDKKETYSFRDVADQRYLKEGMSGSTRTIEGPVSKTRETIVEDRMDKKETYSFRDVADQKSLNEGMSGLTRTIKGPLSKTRDTIDEDRMDKKETDSFRDVADQRSLNEGINVPSRTIEGPLIETKDRIDEDIMNTKESYKIGSAADQRSPKEGINVSSRAIEEPLIKTKDRVNEDRVSTKETYSFRDIADQRSNKGEIGISSRIIEGPLIQPKDTIEEDRITKKETYKFGDVTDQRCIKEEKETYALGKFEDRRGIKEEIRSIKGYLVETKDTIDQDRINKKETSPISGNADQIGHKGSTDKIQRKEDKDNNQNAQACEKMVDKTQKFSSEEEIKRDREEANKIKSSINKDFAILQQNVLELNKSLIDGTKLEASLTEDPCKISETSRDFHLAQSSEGHVFQSTNKDRSNFVFQSAEEDRSDLIFQSTTEDLVYKSTAEDRSNLVFHSPTEDRSDLIFQSTTEDLVFSSTKEDRSGLVFQSTKEDRSNLVLENLVKYKYGEFDDDYPSEVFVDKLESPKSIKDFSECRRPSLPVVKEEIEESCSGKVQSKNSKEEENKATSKNHMDQNNELLNKKIREDYQRTDKQRIGFDQKDLKATSPGVRNNEADYQTVDKQRIGLDKKEKDLKESSPSSSGYNFDFLEELCKKEFSRISSIQSPIKETFEDISRTNQSPIEKKSNECSKSSVKNEKAEDQNNVRQEEKSYMADANNLEDNVKHSKYEKLSYSDLKETKNNFDESLKHKNDFSSDEDLKITYEESLKHKKDSATDEDFKFTQSTKKSYEGSLKHNKDLKIRKSTENAYEENLKHKKDSTTDEDLKFTQSTKKSHQESLKHNEDLKIRQSTENTYEESLMHKKDEDLKFTHSTKKSCEESLKNNEDLKIRQSTENAYEESLKHKKDEDLKCTQSTKKSYEESLKHNEDLKIRQSTENAYAESLKHKKEDEVLKFTQSTKTSCEESLKHNEDLKIKQSTENAHEESLKHKKDTTNDNDLKMTQSTFEEKWKHKKNSNTDEDSKITLSTLKDSKNSYEKSLKHKNDSNTDESFKIAQSATNNYEESVKHKNGSASKIIHTSISSTQNAYEESLKYKPCTTTYEDPYITHSSTKNTKNTYEESLKHADEDSKITHSSIRGTTNAFEESLKHKPCSTTYKDPYITHSTIKNTKNTYEESLKHTDEDFKITHSSIGGTTNALEESLKHKPCSTTYEDPYITHSTIKNTKNTYEESFKHKKDSTTGEDLKATYSTTKTTFEESLKHKSYSAANEDPNLTHSSIHYEETFKHKKDTTHSTAKTTFEESLKHKKDPNSDEELKTIQSLEESSEEDTNKLKHPTTKKHFEESLRHKKDSSSDDEAKPTRRRKDSSSDDEFNALSYSRRRRDSSSDEETKKKRRDYTGVKEYEERIPSPIDIFKTSTSKYKYEEEPQAEFDYKDEDLLKRACDQFCTFEEISDEKDNQTKLKIHIEDCEKRLSFDERQFMKVEDKMFIVEDKEKLVKKYSDEGMRYVKKDECDTRQSWTEKKPSDEFGRSKLYEGEDEKTSEEFGRSKLYEGEDKKASEEFRRSKLNEGEDKKPSDELRRSKLYESEDKKTSEEFGRNKLNEGVDKKTSEEIRRSKLYEGEDKKPSEDKRPSEEFRRSNLYEGEKKKPSEEFRSSKIYKGEDKKPSEDKSPSKEFGRSKLYEGEDKKPNDEFRRSKLYEGEDKKPSDEFGRSKLNENEDKKKRMFDEYSSKYGTSLDKYRGGSSFEYSSQNERLKKTLSLRIEDDYLQSDKSPILNKSQYEESLLVPKKTFSSQVEKKTLSLPSYEYSSQEHKTNFIGPSLNQNKKVSSYNFEDSLVMQKETFSSRNFKDSSLRQNITNFEYSSLDQERSNFEDSSLVRKKMYNFVDSVPFSSRQLDEPK